MKPKVVVIMGATGAGKSRLSIDLASHFAALEILNADSMQLYRGLDVLTNKLPLSERNGVPHHLLDVVDASEEFNSRRFRDLAVPIIDDIIARKGLPVVVGGTNYYIQSLVSPFLVDDLVEDLDSCSLTTSSGDSFADLQASYECLKEIDPVAANRIHPNDHRKIKRYLSLYSCSGVLPSNLFQGEMEEKWGRANDFRYKCCFVWVDASLQVLDRYVDNRVDCMIDAGLLDEVYDIYSPKADYTQGLRQAIGVREFEDFFQSYFSVDNNLLRPNVSEILASEDSNLKVLLAEAINKFKTNTRRLVRRQKRRLKQLETCFDWDFHHIDATEAFFCNSGDVWQTKVVEPCVSVVRKFLLEDPHSTIDEQVSFSIQRHCKASRDLWTQFVCEACGGQILRGAHEWEQHKQGRRHRKRVLRLKKHASSSLA